MGSKSIEEFKEFEEKLNMQDPANIPPRMHQKLMVLQQLIKSKSENVSVNLGLYDALDQEEVMQLGGLAPEKKIQMYVDNVKALLRDILNIKDGRIEVRSLTLKRWRPKNAMLDRRQKLFITRASGKVKRYDLN